MRSITLLLFAFVLGAVPACMNVGASEDVCGAGESCGCSGIGSCARSCDGEGCAFTCSGQGACSFECPDGGCTAVAQGQGATELACEGGGCTLTCQGQGACSLVGCTHDCHVHFPTPGTGGHTGTPPSGNGDFKNLGK